MPNPAHHHCHPFTDFYKGLTCAELKPLLIARKSDTPILWRACLLVVPAGLNPRIYSIGTLHDGVFRPCLYYFKKNSLAECNYEIYDKKMLAIIRCLEKWDAELRNVKFEIRTDHKNLEYLMTVKKLTERQIRWSLILFKHDFVIKYITSKSNERTDV